MNTEFQTNLLGVAVRFLLCAISPYFATIGQAIDAVEAIELNGVIIQSATTNTNTYTYKFNSIIHGYRWKITSTPLETNAAFKYEIMSYDGTNLYWYMQFSGESTNSKNSSTGSIVECKKPPILGGQGYPFLPWLATASNGYFDTEEPGVALDIWTLLDPEAGKNKNKIVIRRHKNPPYLPEYIEFYTDGLWRGYIPQTHQVIRRPYPEPYDKGFITRIYYATNFVSVNGQWFPREFELHHILFKSANIGMPGTNVFELYGIHKGQIQYVGVRKITDEEFVPRTDGKTLIWDHRFKEPQLSISGITYLNTNKSGQWIPKESKTLKRLFEHEVNMRKTISGKPLISGGVNVFLFLMLILAAIFPVFYYVYKNKDGQSR